MAKRVEQLLGLAEAEFGQLSAAEKLLFQSVTNGEVADYSVGSEEVDNPANAHQWEEDRIIKSDRLIWLCTEPEVQKLITFRGINLVGVKIEGELNLDFSRIEFPLSFSKCFFPEPIFLRQAKIPRLSFESSYVVSINAALIQVDGSLLLNTGFQSDGEVNLAGAKIGGNLSCQNGKFVGKEKFAISLEGAKITGSVYLRKNPEVGSDNLQGFQAEGLVRLYRASIGGNLECQGGKFINSKGYAIDAEDTDIKGTVFLRNGFKADGGVNLLSATIGGNLECQDGKFVGKEQHAILLAGAKITGSVLLLKTPKAESDNLQGFQSEGSVRLFRASIGGNLECQGGKFINSQGYALDVEGTDIKGTVLLRNGFEADGGVNLLGATIGGNLECQDGKFVGKENCAILLQGGKITGSVYLRKNPEAGSDNLQGFQAEGLVRLYRASIGGNLECQGGKFINSQGYALDAEGTDVKGAVLLRNGFEADGGVNLLGATIGGSLECQDGKFVGKENCAILLADVKVLGSVSLGKGFQAEGTVMLFNAKINDTILIQNVIKPEKMFLDLQFAKVRILDDSENSWPHEEKINLNGFVYDAISHDSPLDNKKRLKWLRLQKLEKNFSPQPYEQLAKVLRALGHEEEAKNVLIGKQEDRRRYGNLTMMGKLWNRFLGYTIAHGYRPHQTLGFALIFVILGAFLFDHGYSQGLISPSKFDAKILTSTTNSIKIPQEYPEFNSFIYSLDLFLPIVDLRQKSYWQPNAKTGNQILRLMPLLKIQWGSVVQYYFWLHILLGWTLTTLWVAGFTGLVRRLN